MLLFLVFDPHCLVVSSIPLVCGMSDREEHDSGGSDQDHLSGVRMTLSTKNDRFLHTGSKKGVGARPSALFFKRATPVITMKTHGRQPKSHF